MTATLVSHNDCHKHPISLWYLSASYALFMFSYVAINTLLVLYAINVLHFKTSNAYLIYAAFNALVFTSPLAGGYFADNFGYKEAAVCGLIFSLIGTLILHLHQTIFFDFGIAVFIIGYGLCTPAFFCLVGLSYSKDDQRRDSGYTIFYLLFNIGSATAAILAGYIANYLGYTFSFMLAGLALLISVIIFLLTAKKVVPHPGRNSAAQLNKLTRFQSVLALIVIGIVLSPVLLPLMVFPILNEILLWVLVVGACLGVIWLAIKQHHRLAKYRLIAFLILTIMSGFFWSLYMLEASLMTVFADFNVNRHVLGIVIPPSAFYGLDPLGVIIFGIILGWLWHYLAKRQRNPSLPTKFAAALISMGLGYIIFAIGTTAVGKTHLINPLWIVFGYVFLTLGEMLISPIGLSMVGRLSPIGKEGVLMGVWTLFMGFGAVLSGYLADISTMELHSNNPKISNPFYIKYFIIIGLGAVLLGIILSFFIPRIKRLIKG